MVVLNGAAWADHANLAHGGGGACSGGHYITGDAETMAIGGIGQVAFGGGGTPFGEGGGASRRQSHSVGRDQRAGASVVLQKGGGAVGGQGRAGTNQADHQVAWIVVDRFARRPTT